MSFTRSTTNTSVHQGMPDYPSAEGYSTTQLKQAFDAPAEGLKADINRLATELEDTTGAENIGADAIVSGDDSGANIQAKLEKIYTDMQGMSQGQVIDGSITQAKLDSTYEGTIAKKDGTLQSNLSAEMLNDKTEAQLKTAFLSTPNPTTISFTGAAKQTATATETKTYSTNGSRYYLLIFTPGYFGIYDAKTQKFAYAEGDYSSTTTSGRTTQKNSATAYLTKAGAGRTGYDGTLSLTATYNGGTLTLSMTKTQATRSDGNNTPSSTVTIYELGGMV